DEATHQSADNGDSCRCQPDAPGAQAQAALQGTIDHEAYDSGERRATGWRTAERPGSAAERPGGDTAIDRSYSRLAAGERSRLMSTRRWLATVSLGLVFILGWLVFTTVVVVRGVVLDHKTYTSTLVSTQAYDRVYTQVLADPDMARLQEE